MPGLSPRDPQIMLGKIVAVVDAVAQYQPGPDSHGYHRSYMNALASLEAAEGHMKRAVTMRVSTRSDAFLIDDETIEQEPDHATTA